MIVSPGSRCSSSSSIWASVASPAGTMIQTARGFSSCGDELGDRERRASAPSPAISLRLLGRPVVDDDLVAVADEPADHVGAHPAETDEPDVASRSALRGRGRARRRAPARGRPRPASGSAPRWTRRIGRSCDSMRAKSPAAWASMSWPKVYGQPGIGAVDRVVGGQLEEPADRRRRPCGAGRSSGGSAGRSRPSSRAASGRAGAPGSGRGPSSRAGVGAMNAWMAR